MGTGKPSMILCAARDARPRHAPGRLARPRWRRTDYLTPEMYLHIARKAEAGKLHALFFADAHLEFRCRPDRPSGCARPGHPAGADGWRHARASAWSAPPPPPTTALRPGAQASRPSTTSAAAAPAGTRSPPSIPMVAAQFGGGDHPDHENRYASPTNSSRSSLELWDSWGRTRWSATRRPACSLTSAGSMRSTTRASTSRSRARSRSPGRRRDGRPSSRPGRRRGDATRPRKYADVIFTAQHLLEGAIEFRTDMRMRADGHGRNPNDLKVLPGMLCILGGPKRRPTPASTTSTRPRHRARLLKLSRRVGLPVDALELDKPFPVHLLGRRKSSPARSGSAAAWSGWR